MPPLLLKDINIGGYVPQFEVRKTKETCSTAFVRAMSPSVRKSIRDTKLQLSRTANMPGSSETVVLSSPEYLSKQSKKEPRITGAGPANKWKLSIRT
jgi:hypothetical protein